MRILPVLVLLGLTACQYQAERRQEMQRAKYRDSFPENPASTVKDDEPATGFESAVENTNSPAPAAAPDLMARARAGELKREVWTNSQGRITSEKYIRSDGSHYLLLYAEDGQHCEYAYFYNSQDDMLWEEHYYPSGQRKSYRNKRKSGFAAGMPCAIDYREDGTIERHTIYADEEGNVSTVQDSPEE
ncbi:MAG: hypothetical protein JNL57_08610 [Bacteroidetes bacterium]|nr:hypothetical protein [Bacteroidota bacterium]